MINSPAIETICGSVLLYVFDIFVFICISEDVHVNISPVKTTLKCSRQMLHLSLYIEHCSTNRLMTIVTKIIPKARSTNTKIKRTEKNGNIMTKNEKRLPSPIDCFPH